MHLFHHHHVTSTHKRTVQRRHPTSGKDVDTWVEAVVVGKTSVATDDDDNDIMMLSSRQEEEETEQLLRGEDVESTKKMMVYSNNNNIKSTDDTNNNIVTSTSSAIKMPGSGLFWRGVVVVLCVLWSSNFAAAKLIMAEPGVDSSLYSVARFSVAALALLPGLIRAIRKKGVIDWETARGAAICGSWVAFGYIGQIIGLLTTTASRSCVICSLHCVFVAAIVEFRRVSKSAGEKSFEFTRLLPAVVAVLGVAIVELKGAGGDPTIGDLLSFTQPIGFGMGYLQLEELVKKKPDAGLPIAAIKLAVVAFFSYALFVFHPLLHGEIFVPRIPDFTPIMSSPTALGGIAYTGLVTTALALWVESVAFKRVPATDASIILTTEPLFAALVGAITLGETFDFSDYFGASLIIGACALAVLLDVEADVTQCIIDDGLQGKCEAPRTLSIFRKFNIFATQFF